MGSRNDVTGDELKSRPNSKEYAANYDTIFRKRKTVPVPEVPLEDVKLEPLNCSGPPYPHWPL